MRTKIEKIITRKNKPQKSHQDDERKDKPEWKKMDFQRVEISRVRRISGKR